jgi:hypothetical protein
VKPGITVSACCLGEVDERAAQVAHVTADAVDGGAQPQAHVGRDLVVAGTAGVQPLAGVADEIRQPPLDVEVHVLQIERPLELAAFDLAADLRHAALDVREVVRADHADTGEHPGMGDRALDVEEREPVIEEHRCRVAFHAFVDGFVETTGPGLPGRGRLRGRGGLFRIHRWRGAVRIASEMRRALRIRAGPTGVFEESRLPAPRARCAGAGAETRHAQYKSAPSPSRPSARLHEHGRVASRGAPRDGAVVRRDRRHRDRLA